jgi:hypothetical protein
MILTPFAPAAGIALANSPIYQQKDAAKNGV